MSRWRSAAKEKKKGKFVWSPHRKFVYAYVLKQQFSRVWTLLLSDSYPSGTSLALRAKSR